MKTDNLTTIQYKIKKMITQYTKVFWRANQNIQRFLSFIYIGN